MPEFNELNDALRRELRREVHMGGVARARVMSAVRAEAARPQRAGWLLPSVGGALAAGMALTLIGNAIFGQRKVAEFDATPKTAVVGLGTSLGTSLRDTLLLVRFAFRAPRAARVALVGDFNDWRAGVTPLVRDSVRNQWTAEVPMSRGAHQYAYVVNDTQWVADSAAPRVRAPNGRAASQLTLSPH